MAENTHMRNNALPYPIYAQPFTIVFPLLDADGDPISPSSADSERSLNGDTAADCTNEATEISGLTGVCYLDLTAAELTANVVAIETTSTGAKTTINVLYPRKLVVIRSGTANDDGSGTSTIVLDSGASAVDDFYNGMAISVVIDGGAPQVRLITDYVGSTKTATVHADFLTAVDNTDTFTIYMPEGHQIQQADAVAWLGSALAAVTTAGVPEVDVTHWRGGAVPAVSVTGVPEVDITHVNGAAQTATLDTIKGDTVDIETDTQDIQSKIGTPAGASVSADIAAVKSETATIVADTNELQTDWANGGRLDLILDARASQTTADAIEADTQDIQSRLPDALTAGGNIKADALAISGDTTAADNAESFFDGTGYGPILQRTTIATLASQTSFTLSAGSADDDAYNGCVIVVQDASTAAQKAVGVIADYVGSTKTVTLRTDPAVFTIATTDIVTILADRSLKSTVDNRTLDVTTGGAAGIDWGNVENPTTTVGLTGTTIAWNSAWDAEVQSEVDDALVALKLDHLVAVADNDDPVNDSIIAKLAASDGDWSGFSPSTDALEAIRDRGDAAWATATGFSTHSAADVWAVATRVLTAGTNIALAKGTGVTGFNDLSAAQVNAEVVDALATDTYAEPTGTPSTTATIAAKLGLIQMALVNGLDITASKKQFKDAAGNVEWEKDLSDDGSTYTESAGNAP